MNRSQHHAALVEAIAAANAAGLTVCFAPDAFGGVLLYFDGSDGHCHAGGVEGYWPRDAARWILGELQRCDGNDIDIVT